MARLITVSIDCRDKAAQQTFEEIISRRRNYLLTKGSGTGTADILLLELDELRPEQTFRQIRELISASPDIEVFLTASRTDPQMLLEAFRIGVKEFLPQPLTRQEVEPALSRFEERFNGKVGASDSHTGKIISVIGASGGVGVSTVVTNLASSVQHARQRDPVAIMDLNLHGGDLGLFLDLQADSGFKQLSRDLSRLDETIVRSMLVRHTSGVQLLASGYQAFEEVEQIPGSTMRVMSLLRAMHQHVFVDCGHVLDQAVKEALDSADQVIIVTTLSLPVIRRTKCLLHTLRTAQYPAGKINVVVNRYINEQKEFLAETENLLEVKIAGLIPNDYGTASEAINHGQPLTLMSKTTLGQWYLRGTAQLVGEKPVTQGKAEQTGSNRASFLGRYLPSFALGTRE